LSSAFLSTLALSIFGLFLFIVMVMVLPHKENLEQTQQWKISILYAAGSFLLWPLIVTVIYLYEIFTESTSLPISSLFVSIMTRAILPGSCIGVYFAIFIFLMIYWKFRTAPWSSLDSQAGASTFDAIVNRFTKIVKGFRRAG
jgi:NADH:ubiquinone oxidoreductase subunit 6 (subunit J)